MFKVNNKDTRTTPDVVLVSLLLTLNIFSHLILVLLLLMPSKCQPGWKKIKNVYLILGNQRKGLKEDMVNSINKTEKTLKR